MSTILKALEKARRERSQNNDAKVATLLDVPSSPAARVPKVVVQHRSRLGLIITSIVASTVVTLALITGVILFLQHRLQEWTRNLQGASSASTVAVVGSGTLAPGSVQPGVKTSMSQPTPGGAAPPPSPANPASVAVSSAPSAAVDLPTPVPMTELLNSSGAGGANFAEREIFSPPASSPQVRFSPQPLPTEDTKGFVLGPILYDPKSPMAIVNGLSVRKGGVYENFRVLDITPDSVTVQRPGESPVVLRKRR
ncbi:MAG: hypothetical protein ACPL7D_01135 [Candidatus Sumerlaeaceae bacterium]